MGKATLIQDSEFKQLLRSEKMLVVDYTASWCGPCRLISPYIDQLAEEYEGRAKVVKIDLDQNPEQAKELGIRSLPSVLFFKDGEMVEKMVGKATYEAFSTTLEKHL